MLSGPVSEVSRGPVASGRTMTSGSVHSISAGAVKKDIDRPLGERISDPLTELEPLQETLRALREGRVPAEAVEDEESAPRLPAVAPAPVPDLGAAPAVGEDLGEGTDGGTAGADAGPPVAGDEFQPQGAAKGAGATGQDALSPSAD